MTTTAPASFRSRVLQAAAACCLAAGCWPSAVVAAAPAAAASVAAVQSHRVADLVLLDRGFDAGLREGMVCRIARGTTHVAEVLLVELRPTCAAALILEVAPRQSIRAGDAVSLKILKT